MQVFFAMVKMSLSSTATKTLSPLNEQSAQSIFLEAYKDDDDWNTESRLTYRNICSLRFRATNIRLLIVLQQSDLDLAYTCSLQTFCCYKVLAYSLAKL